jgi:hypothetical protein
LLIKNDIMKVRLTPLGSIGLVFALCLPFRLAQAQPLTNQPAVQSWSSDPRVQSRSYVFANTGERLPYAVFVSTKVAKEKPAPLIVALPFVLVFIAGVFVDLLESWQSNMVLGTLFGVLLWHALFSLAAVWQLAFKR